jgi:hypothetical protein
MSICFAKNEKQTGVEAGDFVFKHEGSRIQHSFNSERADKLAKLESFVWIVFTVSTFDNEIIQTGLYI